MAKRGRKPLITTDSISFKDIECAHCGKMIDNSTGNAVYRIVTYAALRNGLHWPTTIRVHPDCYTAALTAHKESLYGYNPE